MKPKSRLVTALALVALAALMTFGIFRGEQPVQAQGTAPQVERISFGMVGITRGQTARVNVTNISEAICPCSRVTLTFLDGAGEVLRTRDGQPVQRTMTPEPGHSAFLQISADEFLARNEARVNFRAVVTLIPPSGEAVCPCAFPVTVEALNNATGRTEWVLSGGISTRIPPPVAD